MRLFNSAREYHEKTKYVFNDVKSVYSEYASEPSPGTYKQYENKPAVDLPRNFADKTMKLDEAFQRSAAFSHFRMIKKTALELNQLSQLLYLTNGVTDVREFSSGKFYLKSAPSASGLYPVEIYVLVNNVKDIAPGVYYFSPQKHQLVQLNDGNLMDEAVEAGFNQKMLQNAPAIFFLTAVFPRSEWKFRNRAYRYCLMDAGYVGENLVMAAAGLGLAANLNGDFVDEKVSELLQIDSRKEAALMMAAVGEDGGELETDKYEFGMINPEADTLGADSRDLALAIHRKSAHFFPNEDNTHVQVKFPFRKTPGKISTGSETTELPPPDKPAKNPEIQQLIQNRRSSHQFLRFPLSIQELSRLMHNLQYVPVLYDYPAYQTYMVINDVENLQNGLYLYHRGDHKVEILRRGTFRGDISYMTLAQDAVFNSSVALFFSTDFREMNIFSNRGYRYAHFNIGMLSESIYLSAASMGLAVRGIGNFFDDSINSFFRVQEPDENILGGIIVGKS